VGRRLSEDELQQTLDFCSKLFAPTSPEEHRATERFLVERTKGQAGGNSDPEAVDLRFMDVHAPLIDPQIIEAATREQPTPRSASDAGNAAPDLQSNARNATTDAGSEVDVKTVLEKVNARRMIHSEQGNGVHNFEDEPLGQSDAGGGWVAKLEKGRLGLIHADLSVH